MMPEFMPEVFITRAVIGQLCLTAVPYVHTWLV